MDKMMISQLKKELNILEKRKKEIKKELKLFKKNLKNGS